jgi:outer membrane protein TolC
MCSPQLITTRCCPPPKATRSIRRKKSLNLTRESYHAGNVGVLQVIDAERLCQRTRLEYVRAETQRYVDTAQLYLALGGAEP